MASTIRLDVKSHPALTGQEQQEVDRLAQSVFAGQDEGLLWATPDWHVLLRVAGVLVTHIDIVQRICLVGGRPVQIGGVGGVATVPEQRKKGYGSMAMQRAADFLRQELNLDFGLLMCGPKMAHFYQNLGWQAVKDPMLFDQPNRKIQCDGVTMIISCNGNSWPEGKIDLCGLPW